MCRVTYITDDPNEALQAQSVINIWHVTAESQAPTVVRRASSVASRHRKEEKGGIKFVARRLTAREMAACDEYVFARPHVDIERPLHDGKLPNAHTISGPPSRSDLRPFPWSKLRNAQSNLGSRRIAQRGQSRVTISHVAQVPLCMPCLVEQIACLLPPPRSAVNSVCEQLLSGIASSQLIRKQFPGRFGAALDRKPLLSVSLPS